MKKSKFVLWSIVLTMCIGLVSGCGKTNLKTEQDKINVVCTIFPQYDWVREIVGDKADGYDLKLLMDSGIDLHSYQPTAEDITKISNSDLLIYVGGESDEWVEDALKEAVNKDMKVINLMEVLGARVQEEKSLEGMEPEEGHGEEDHGEESHEEEHGHEEEGHGHEYDEHVWLSLKNAQIITDEIGRALEDIDAKNADYYKKNTESYIKKLSELDGQYQAMVDTAKRSEILFGDRFPFSYLADDYGLTCFAAFAGCSAETEASFQTIAFLAEKTEELQLPAVLVIDHSNQKMAKAIIENTAPKNQEVLSMYSMQAVTGEELAQGITYLLAMADNLEILRQALN